MLKLTFENSYGKERELGVFKDRGDALLCIRNFLNEHDFKSYYFRIWSPEEGHQIIDVGSHTEFFHIYDENC